jgi:hypothetical protein
MSQINGAQSAFSMGLSVWVRASTPRRLPLPADAYPLVMLAQHGLAPALIATGKSLLPCSVRDPVFMHVVFLFQLVTVTVTVTDLVTA